MTANPSTHTAAPSASIRAAAGAGGPAPDNHHTVADATTTATADPSMAGDRAVDGSARCVIPEAPP